MFGFGSGKKDKNSSGNKNQYSPNQLGYQNVNNHGYQSNDYPADKVGGYNNSVYNGKQIWKENAIIMSKKAKKNLDVCQDKEAKGMLIIYQDFNQPNQRFDIVKDGDSVNIIARHSKNFLTVGSNSDKNGAPIFQDPTPGLVGQRFRLAHLGGDEYLIHTFCGKVLDCCEESVDNGTRVIQWHCDRKQHQIWIIK